MTELVAQGRLDEAIADFEAASASTRPIRRGSKTCSARLGPLGTG